MDASWRAPLRAVPDSSNLEEAQQQTLNTLKAVDLQSGMLRPLGPLCIIVFLQRTEISRPQPSISCRQQFCVILAPRVCVPALLLSDQVLYAGTSTFQV